MLQDLLEKIKNLWPFGEKENVGYGDILEDENFDYQDAGEIKKSFIEKLKDKLSNIFKGEEKNKNNKSGEKKEKKLAKMEITIGGVSLTQKAFFAKNLAVMLKSGLTITDALEISIDSNSGKLKKILSEIRSSITSGRSFSEALKEYPKVFPPFFTSAVYAGEKSGTLEENLEQIATQLTKEKELASKIKGAMIYPVIIMIAAFALGMFVSFNILPKIIPLFEGLGSDLPITTRGLIAFSHFISQHGQALFWGIILGAIFMGWLVRQKFSKPALHWIFLHAPIIKKISRASNLARFSRILGMLLKSGLSIDEALDITKNSVGNYYYRTSLENIMARINKGASLSKSLAEYENLYPRISAKMIKVGEESGKLDESLLYIASFYEEDVDNATKMLSIAIEPILLLVIGTAVGFLALAIITPIYNITGNVNKG